MAAAKRGAKRSQDGPSYLPTYQASEYSQWYYVLATGYYEYSQWYYVLATGYYEYSQWYYVLATGYYEYSHLQYAAVRSCHSPPRRSASAAAVPAHLQWGTSEYSRWYSTYLQGLTRVL